MNQSNRNVMTSARKRKDRGGIDDSLFYTHRGSFVNNKKPHFPHQPHNKNIITTSTGYNNNKNNINKTLPYGSGRLMSAPGSGSGPVQGPSNRILAGYMAYEFLTKGTLFGQKFDPARAEAVPVSAAEPMRKPAVEPVGVKPNRSYHEVARLLKGDGGAHIPGIFNPTQLARWIQM